MTKALYDKGRELFLSGLCNWANANIRAALVESGYVFSASHNVLSDVNAYITVASEISANITNKSITSGVADGDNALCSSVTAGKTIAGVVIYVYNATNSSARLIAYIDEGTGFPLATDGSNVNVIWDDGATKIFKL